jgi:NADPH2:quinone reductase
LRKVPVPEPAADQVRLKVAFVGMNPVDALVRRERLDWMPVQFPFTPGLEHTGVVEAVGPGVDPSWLHRRVLSRLSFGGYAEYAIAPTRGLLQVPEGLSLRDGCVYRGCSYTAWHALHKCANLQAGERVLVHSAAGAVGLMALQIAREAGAWPVGACGGPTKVDWVRSFGFDEVVDYLRPDWVTSARGFAGEHGYDVILDGNGGPNAEHNYDLVAVSGRIMYLGIMAGSYPSPVPIPTLINKSFWVGGMTLRQVEEPPGSAADRAIIEGVRSGRWRLPISEVVALADVASLHRRLEARAVRGRAVIEVGGETIV